MRELERRFSPEFRNRIDEVVMFSPLAKDEVGRSRCSRSRDRADARASGRTLTVTPGASRSS
jgi:ATP-dependent Clp protease ATP-binding subunit ClpA